MMAPGGGGGKGLSLPLTETLRHAWADPDLRSRIIFVFSMFAVFVIGVHIPVPIGNISPDAVAERLQRVGGGFFQLIDTFGGGALKRVSIFALGLNPYITSSIIMQILTTAFPEWKKEMQEGGEYARKKQNQRTRALTLALCIMQSVGFLGMMGQALPLTPMDRVLITIFWTAGSMFVLWIGEQISEKGIGNGVSLMIFVGILISMPGQFHQIGVQMGQGIIQWWQTLIMATIFAVTTWFIVFFTTAQRRIPIQHMRRQVGTRVMGGQTSYLPIPVNMAGVIPIIFSFSLIFIPSQIAGMFPPNSQMHTTLTTISEYLIPGPKFPQGIVGTLAFGALIFFFTYFYTAIQYNVEDLANNLKRQNSYIQGIRPGKQTKEFLDGIISRITIAGAFFLTIIAVMQYFTPSLAGVPPSSFQMVGGTSLLIVVSVALETMRQMEASILMKRYNQ